MSYIDSISDLPTSPLDVQALVSNIGGTLDGDAGNDGYSSEIGGIVSFAGGINDLAWAEYDGGDHTIFVGEVMSITKADGNAAAFFKGKLGQYGVQ